MIKFINLFSIIFVLTIIPFNLFCQFTLTIEISGFKNNNGQVLLELSNEKLKKNLWFYKTIENNKCIIIIQNLKPGNYTFKYFHDENKNQKLDVNIIGIPKEGFGFSNNAKGNFGPPLLEKTIFKLKENTTLKCNPIYY